MAIEHIKSGIITNLDAAPVVQPTAGEGGPAPLKTVDGYATPSASASVASTYQLVRVPSNAKIKSVVFESEAQGAGAFDIGVYYATDGEGGKPTSLLLANTINAALFGAAISCASAVLPTEQAGAGTGYTLDKRAQPLWQAAGLATDPGGYFDICAVVKTTAVTTGTGKLGIRVGYTD